MPKRIEPAGLDESAYRVHSRVEIAAILDALRKDGNLITASFGDGKDFFLTAVIAVLERQNRVVLDCGSDAATNRRALAATGITFTASHQRIKIQFSAESISLVRFDEREAFSMALPATLLRLQRRQFFRIDVPLTQPLKCIIPSGDPAAAPVQVAILDISCGGVAIVDAGSLGDFPIGLLLRGCTIHLRDMGIVSTDLLVRSAFTITLKNGARRRRFGFEFQNITERGRTMIQRCINAMERERGDRLAR
jgi:c-di-GMP-binding flagellar brake protein YcgR